MNIEDINKRKIFWNGQHNSKIVGSLSGCQFNETINFLKINSILKPDDNVLEVGVGLGYVTKGLKEFGCHVSGLEISDVALNNVKEYCEHTYTVEELSKMPNNYFDIIIADNCVQHIPTDLLTIELTELIRSLKPQGILALQFVSGDKVEDTGINVNYFGENTGRYLRTPTYLSSFIRNLGGDCEMVVDNNNRHNSSEVTGCHVFHVRKIIENNKT